MIRSVTLWTGEENVPMEEQDPNKTGMQIPVQTNPANPRVPTSQMKVTTPGLWIRIAEKFGVRTLVLIIVAIAFGAAAVYMYIDKEVAAVAAQNRFDTAATAASEDKAKTIKELQDRCDKKEAELNSDIKECQDEAKKCLRDCKSFRQ